MIVTDYKGEGFLQAHLAEYDFKVDKVGMLIKGGVNLSLHDVFMITEKVRKAYEANTEEVMFKVDVDEDSSTSLEEIKVIALKCEKIVGARRYFYEDEEEQSDFIFQA